MGISNLRTLDPSATTTKFRCRVAAILATLDPEDREFVEAALSPESGLQHKQIAVALTADGYKVSRWTVGTHRNNECACAEVSK